MRQFHDLTVTQEMDWERWHLLLRDDFMASPGAAFTGTGMGGPGLVAQFASILGFFAEQLRAGICSRARRLKPEMPCVTEHGPGTG